MKSFSDIWYHSADGLTLYARDYSSNHSGTAIVCLHGLTRNSADFSGLCEHLSHKYRVVAPDQRGRGRSEYDTDTSRYNPMVYVQDMLALFDHLELNQIILIGTSLGGLMSILLSSMQPQRVHAVILNDIGPDIDTKGLDRIKSYISNPVRVLNWEAAVVETKKINGNEFPRLNDEQWTGFTRNLYRENAQGQPELAYDHAISEPLNNGDATSIDLWPFFDSMISKPVLLIRGANSDILSLNCVDQMYKHKPDLQFVEIPECGHAPLLNEVESVTAIDGFLSSLSLNSAA